MRVHQKYSTILFAILMSVGMSFSQSLVLSIINLRGFYLDRWLLAFAIGFIVSLPTSIIIIPIVRKTVSRLTAE